MMAAEGPIAPNRMSRMDKTVNKRDCILLLLGTDAEAAKLYKPQYGMSNYICIELHVARPQPQFWYHDCTCQLAGTVMV